MTKTGHLGAKILMMFSTVVLLSCNPPQKDYPLRLSTNSWVGYEPFYIAESMGYFSKDAIHLIEMPFSLTMDQSLRAGTLDAAAVSLSRALSLVGAGHDITVLMILNWSNGADQLIAHPSIKSVVDLKGKTVGAEENTVNGYLLQRALQINGLSISDITFKHTQNTDVADAFRAGEIMAGAVYGAEIPILLSLGARPIFDSSDIPGEILDVLIVRTPYLEQNPDKIEQLILAWFKGVDHLKHIAAGAKRPIGLMSDKAFKAAIRQIKFASIIDNTDFLQNTAKKLEALINLRLALTNSLGISRERSRTSQTKPLINSVPFFDAISKVGE